VPRASGIFSLFRVELCDFSRKMMYILGIGAQTSEFEQYILNTGKKRNQATSSNINELEKNPSEKVDSKVVLKKSGRKTPSGTLDL
jgi:hypothetical protein